MYALCGRSRLLTALQCFTMLASSGRWRLLTLMQFLSILHTSGGRRKLILAKQIFTTADFGAIKIIHHVIFKGMELAGLHNLAHDCGDAGLVQRIRAQLGEAAGGQPMTLRKAKLRGPNTV